MLYLVSLAATLALAVVIEASAIAVRNLAGAQVITRPARVGLLLPGGLPSTAPVERAFVERLRELGWTEGQNLVLEIRRAQGKPEMLPALASNLLQSQVHVMVASGTTAIQAARQVTDRVPIVMAGGGDPVATGLVKTLARPGGNITGVSLLGQELVTKTLSLLREVVPRAKRIDVLANAANPANAFFARTAEAAGHTLGVESRLLEIRKPDELETVITATQADALVVLADSAIFLPNARRIADTALKRRLPLAGLLRAYVEAGSLMSYTLNFADVFRRAADYTDRILKGGNPAELPVEEPTRYELLMNLRTARALGLTIPQPLLIRADQVLE